LFSVNRALTWSNAQMSVVTLGHGVPPFAVAGRFPRSLGAPGSWLVLGQGVGHAGNPEVVESLGAARVDAVMFGAATELCAEQ